MHRFGKKMNTFFQVTFFPDDFFGLTSIPVDFFGFDIWFKSTQFPVDFFCNWLFSCRLNIKMTFFHLTYLQWTFSWFDISFVNSISGWLFFLLFTQAECCLRLLGNLIPQYNKNTKTILSHDDNFSRWYFFWHSFFFFG